MPTSRISLTRLLEGGAIGIALWCVFFSFQLLPGIAADTWGILIFAIAGMIVEILARPVLLVILVLAAAVVALVTQTSLSNSLAARWIRNDRLPAAAVDAAVVLSASVNPNNTMSNEALDQLLTGLQLVRDGKAKSLVTTSVQERFPRSTVSSTIDQSRVIALFDGRVKWVRIPPTESTREEAVKSAELLLPTGVRRIAVVASPMHTRRACSTFEAVGFTVTCIAALSRSVGGGDPAPWPADRLRVFGDWVYEVLATLKYRRSGWLKAT